MSVLRFLRGPSALLGFGLVVSGAAGSGFLAIVIRSVSDKDFAALSGLNFLLATISTGVMSGLEQEMARGVSKALALGTGAAAVIRRQSRQGFWLIAGTVAVVCALSPVLVTRWLGGHWYLFGELLIGLLGTLGTFQVRGLLSGRQDFKAFSVTLIVEGVARLLPSILILAFSNGSTWVFGLLFAVGPVLAALSGMFGPWVRKDHAEGGAAAEAATAAAVAEPDEVERRSVSNLVLLTAASLANQLLLNAVPLLVVARYSGSKDPKIVGLVAAISAAVGLTRLGILVLFSLQAPLLPRLTAAAARGDYAEVRRRTVPLLGLCTAVGLTAVAACWLIGPWTVHTIMGARSPLPGGFLAALAAGTLFMMVGLLLQSALIALGRHKMVLLAWSLGVAVTIPVFLLSDSILTTTAATAVAGPLVAAVLMAVDMQWATTVRRPHADGAEALAPVQAGRPA
jgi:O-antigen/teichoic acid export membrane protein